MIFFFSLVLGSSTINPELTPTGLDQMPEKFWHEAQVVLWPSTDGETKETFMHLNPTCFRFLLVNFFPARAAKSRGRTRP